MLGKSLEAALSSASDGSREARRDAGPREGEGDSVGDGGEVGGTDGGWDCIPSRWMASLEAFSRMYTRSASVRPGRASLMSTRRTLVGEPCDGCQFPDIMMTFSQATNDGHDTSMEICCF